MAPSSQSVEPPQNPGRFTFRFIGEPTPITFLTFLGTDRIEFENLLFKAIFAQSQLAAKKFFNPLRPRLRSVFFTTNLHSISGTTWTDEERKPPYRLQNCSTMCRLSKRIVGSFEWQPHPVNSVNPSLSGNRLSKSQCKGRQESHFRIWGVGVRWGQQLAKSELVSALSAKLPDRSLFSYLDGWCIVFGFKPAL
jgi:hypothetical protein